MILYRYFNGFFHCYLFLLCLCRPAKKQQRLNFYQSLLPLEFTHVFYESSHRIKDSIAQINEVFGDQVMVVIGRELTKRFEQTYRGKVAELSELFDYDANMQKGEFVVAIEAAKIHGTAQLTHSQQQLATSLKPYLPPKIAAKIVAEQFNINKKKVYQFILENG